MADEEAFLCDAFLVDLQISDVPMHFLDSIPIPFWIICCGGVSLRHLRITVLHVGHVDVDDAVPKSEHVERFVSPAVVDDGNSQPFPICDQKGGHDLGGELCRRDEIDVVGAGFLEAEHFLGELRWSKHVSMSQMADGVVLAEDTTQVASGEEDRARTSKSGNRGFLAVMEVVGGDDRLESHPAEAGPVLEPIHIASPGTNVA